MREEKKERGKRKRKRKRKRKEWMFSAGGAGWGMEIPAEKNLRSFYQFKPYLFILSHLAALQYSQPSPALSGLRFFS